jgi:acetyltransferase-like isoleucine patch superfamily enzyme
LGDVEIREAGVVDVEFGRNVTIVSPVNLYGCAIGDDCFIGPFVEIQRTAQIGARTRIQSHSFICQLVSIGDDCMIGHGVVTINDKFATGAPTFEPEDWGRTQIGNRVSVGSNVTLLPVRICDDAVIGAGSVVTRDIDEPGIYAGNPARFLSPLPERGEVP